jgi:surface polysaccharide O-acyltransferase-like enzyme
MTVLRPVVMAALSIVALYALVVIWIATMGRCGGGQELGVIAFYSIIYAYYLWFLPLVVIPVGLWALFRFREINLSTRNAAMVTAVLVLAAAVCNRTIHTTTGCAPVGM